MSRHNYLRNFLLIGLAAAASACGGGGGGGGSSGGSPSPEDPRGPDPFVFSTAPLTSYQRIDRMGGPVTATVLLLTRDKDPFNAADPLNDADFVGRQVTQLTKIHYELGDDLQAAGLTLCSRHSADINQVDVSKCVSQAAPFIVPDVLRLKLSEPDGYPNGRDFSTSVVNRLLAFALLDRAVHDIDTVNRAGIISPANNDVSYSATFPYLGDPHLAP